MSTTAHLNVNSNSNQDHNEHEQRQLQTIVETIEFDVKLQQLKSSLPPNDSPPMMNDQLSDKRSISSIAMINQWKRKHYTAVEELRMDLEEMCFENKIDPNKSTAPLLLESFSALDALTKDLALLKLPCPTRESEDWIVAVFRNLSFWAMFLFGCVILLCLLPLRWIEPVVEKHWGLPKGYTTPMDWMMVGRLN